MHAPGKNFKKRKEKKMRIGTDSAFSVVSLSDDHLRRIRLHQTAGHRMEEETKTGKQARNSLNLGRN